MNPLQWWLQSDAVSQACALVLLLMSLASWVVIVWQAYSLGRAPPVPRCGRFLANAPLSPSHTAAGTDRPQRPGAGAGASRTRWRERAQHAAVPPHQRCTGPGPAKGGPCRQLNARALRSCTVGKPPLAAAMGPGAAGQRGRHGPVCGSAGHGMGHSGAGRHGIHGAGHISILERRWPGPSRQGAVKPR